MKKILQFLPLLLIILTFFYSLTHLQQVNQITQTTFSSVKQLFFSLYFLMFIFSVANDCGLFMKLGKMLAFPMKIIFNMNPREASIYLASIFAGYPTFAKLIKENCQAGQISKSSANYLLKISSHGSIGFIVLTLGTQLYHDLKIGWIVFLAQVFSNFIIALFIRPSKIAIMSEINHKKIPLMKIIKNQMVKCLIVFIYIFGFMLVFNILCSMFFINQPLIHGLLEFSNGCLQLKNFGFKKTIIISTGMIAFSSLSVIFQTISLLDGLSLDIKGYIVARIFQSLISMIIVYFLI